MSSNMDLSEFENDEIDVQFSKYHKYIMAKNIHEGSGNSVATVQMDGGFVLSKKLRMDLRQEIRGQRILKWVEIFSNIFKNEPHPNEKEISEYLKDKIIWMKKVMIEQNHPDLPELITPENRDEVYEKSLLEID